MNIAKNLQFLRKRDKITQEELADKLGVSRQSVSKWETGEAYPETEKLILLCDMFGVTLDDLMRGDVTEKTETAVRIADKEEVKKHFEKFSTAMAVGLFLILTGAAVCVAFAGYAQTLAEKQANIVSIISIVALFIFIAAACFLFVMYGTAHEKFKKSNTVLQCPFDEKEVKEFSKKFAVVMACLVAGMIADIAFLVVLSNLIDDEIIVTANQDAAFCYILSAFFAVLAFTLGGCAFMGIRHSLYNVEEYNKDNASSPRKKLISAICSAVMLTATAVFMIIGFVCNAWHPAWVVFPVGGILCGIISTLGNRE